METFQVQFFSDDFSRFFLNGLVGLKKDKDIQAENVDLYLYNQVYVPEENYFNCDPFPIEWLEIFEKDIDELDMFEK